MMASFLGKTLKGRYRVDDALGRGGMAEVYKVFDLQRGVPLAMKVLREDLAEDRVFLRRFQREARNLSTLQHPNIVRFYGLEQEGNIAFILMDFIEGVTLRRKIFDGKKPFTSKQVYEILKPVCSALHYAHQMGIVHCDLKSANIMLDKNGKVYLTDFGIARMTDVATSTMVGIGTPAYMAPELIRGQDPTPQTDIYALGVLLYEMYTGGERPFTGEQANTTGTTAEKVRWEHLHRNPPSLLDVNPKVNETSNLIVQKCLAKKPKERYQNSLQLLQAIENALSLNDGKSHIGKKNSGKTGIRGNVRKDDKWEEVKIDELDDMEDSMSGKGNKTTRILLAFFVCVSVILGFIIYQLVKDDYRIAIVKNDEISEDVIQTESAEEPTLIVEEVEGTLEITQTPNMEEVCTNEAELVSETYKDGYLIKPGISITKTWVVKNTGTCIWDTDYQLVFESGSRMSGPESVDFPKVVNPDEELELSLDLRSPDEEGLVPGYWQLRSNNDVDFFRLYIVLDTTTHFNPLNR